MSHNVVVTGVGLLTPLGNTTEDTWAGIIAGSSGIGYITHFDTTGFPVRIAGEVKNFDTSRVLDRKDLKKTDYFIHYALGAAQEAVCSSGLRITPENASRVG